MEIQNCTFLKTNLKPQEYYYLYSTLRANPAEMIIYALKSLCVSGDLELYSKYLIIPKSSQRKRSRAFLRLNTTAQKREKSSAEELILSLLKEGEELRVYEIRLRLDDTFDEKLSVFKDKYVYEDVKAKGYTWLQYFLTTKGRTERKNCANLIDDIEKEAKLPNPDTTKLNQMLIDLGSNTILLDDDVLRKLKIYKPEYGELDLLFGVGMDSYSDSNGYSIGGIGMYGSSGGYSGGGGFSGFGGGSFGGGGGGGSW